MAHIYQLEPFQNGSYWYCNDPVLCGYKGVKWHIPARLLGVDMKFYLSLLVCQFNAQILGWNGKTLVYGFKTETDAKKYCQYINKKAKSVAFIV